VQDATLEQPPEDVERAAPEASERDARPGRPLLDVGAGGHGAGRVSVGGVLEAGVGDALEAGVGGALEAGVGGRSTSSGGDRLAQRRPLGWCAAHFGRGAWRMAAIFRSRAAAASETMSYHADRQ